jgi:epoxyqueuosine reductase
VGLQRNVCIALGNIGDAIAVPALAHVLGSGDVVVKCHAAWALGRMHTPEAIANLNSALVSESDPEVLEEIRDALAEACV